MTRSFILAALIALTAACGGGANGTCSATDIPTACPSGGAPSYSQSVAPIISAQCSGCHSFGGYASTAAKQSSILSRVGNCSMPQGSSLSAADRATLLDWAVCGAPNN